MRMKLAGLLLWTIAGSLVAAPAKTNGLSSGTKQAKPQPKPKPQAKVKPPKVKKQKTQAQAKPKPAPKPKVVKRPAPIIRPGAEIPEVKQAASVSVGCLESRDLPAFASNLGVEE